MLHKCVFTSVLFAVTTVTSLQGQESMETHKQMHMVEYLGVRPSSTFSEAVRVGNTLYLSG